MKYRKMPKSPERLSSLGFGCMRFPTDKDGNIDEAKSFAMLHEAYQAGVNYYDTAWGYHNSQSEPFLGRFLKQINRDKVYVATKLPCWLIKTREDMDDYLAKQLERLQTDHIDYYLLHALNKGSWKMYTIWVCWISCYRRKRRERSVTSAFLFMMIMPLSPRS